jgi:3-phenylpropionate/trans-cinnamate dioxygenase ferredoxin reductase subunit
LSAEVNQNACVVIVGAGHAGGSAAAFLRQYGHEGRIVLIGDEPLLPYQRPPLSKAWLKGEADAESLSLKPAEWYADNNVSLRLEGVAERINRSEKTVTLASGEAIAYDFLILATGARARELPIPGSDLAGVLALRTAADAELLKHALGPDKRYGRDRRRLCRPRGGGFGPRAGQHATIVERESRVLARVACETLSLFFQDYHGKHGVTFALNAGVAGFEGENGHVTGVRFADGRVAAAMSPWWASARFPMTSWPRTRVSRPPTAWSSTWKREPRIPFIFAIGDVTHRPLPLYERQFRLESVPNALEQAKQAASAILGRPGPSPEVPWFWSDQYDLKLQIAGLPFEADRQIVRGDIAAAKFAVFHLKGDLLQAVEAVNAPPEFMAGKQLIAKRTPVDATKLADPSVSMKEVAA